MPDVIVIVADDTFLPHAKSLMVNCRRQGGWQGDFCVIMPSGCDGADLVKRGIPVLHVHDTGFMAKFWIFSDFFKSWSRALYLDCDVLVLSDLAPLLQQLASYEPLEDGTKPIIADLEDTPAWMIFERAAHGSDLRDRTFMQLVQEYPCVLTKFWNTSILVFDPSSIPENTPAALQAVQEKYRILNNPEEEGTDQQIIHIALYERLRKVKEKLFCFWGLDEPNAQVASEQRGWHGGEVPLAVHYARWHAPWITKTPKMDGYRNGRLKRVCHEFYAENLAAFDTEFPR